MPEMSIQIGAHIFSIPYSKGEGQYLRDAVKILDEDFRENVDFASLSREATLLMAGLLLADKFAGVIDLIESFSENRVSGIKLVEKLGPPLTP